MSSRKFLLSASSPGGRTQEMAEPTRNAADELEHQRIWEQGDLVVEGFNRLYVKYSVHQPLDRRRVRDGIRSTNSDHGAFVNLSIDEIASSERSLDELSSHLLPDLQRQVNKLSHSLSLFSLETELDSSKFELLSQIQLELEQTLDQMNSLIVVICPESLFAPYRSDDQNLKRLKSYRRFSLKEDIYEASRLISQLFDVGREILEEVKQPPKMRGESQHSRCRMYIMYMKRTKLTKFLTDSSQAAIDCIEGSELDVAENNWQRALVGINSSLHEITTLLLPLTRSLRRGSRGDYRPEPDDAYLQEIQRSFDREHLVHGPVIQLARSIKVIIKISKRFFDKISRGNGMNTKRLQPLFTEMSSKQIDSLNRSVVNVSNDLSILIRLSRSTEMHYDQDPETATIRSRHFIQVVNELKSHFDAPLVVLLLYLVPSIPDTHTGLGLSIQDYYKDWFRTWNTLLILAIENFINLARRIDTNLH
ncbi:hypothetical protein Pst134EA_028017 [Puccinia striiformis f. sp. tritici]|nr:hypothetical protein Pst134EA_028017 [Puccinia striiformis f. sp. tritici]KAH9448725.1 hypothetical protein Pst134EA_028017 [Puccinia striiformis f. sp. tritici]KAI9624863.1 hypothetical protein H4Q26_016638 [Puccinia striiformis f. sp. tritici PST-130]